jgi:hypothetical protein
VNLKGKIVDALLGIVVFFVIIIFGGLKDSHKIDSDIKKDIDATLLTMNERDLTLPSKGYSLDILPVNIHRTDNDINLMLRSTGDKSGSFTFRYDYVGIFTMSAQGVDGLQHLANTYLEGFQPFKVDNIMMPLYVLSQRKRYILDDKLYPGRSEVWQSSRQAFYYPRGDCEDHAIALADWLIEMGEDARVVLGDWDGGGHAWVILFKNGKEFLLEATTKRGLSRNKPYPAAILHRDYHPEYMFNREYFWENTGSKLTTKYSGKYWKKKSRYNYKS